MIAYIDLDHHLILNVVLLPTLIATLALLALASLGTNEWNRLGRAVICAIVLGAFYLLLSIIWKGGMGDGDIKLAFILGLITGWLGWSQFIIGAFAAFFIGGFLSLVLIIGKKSRYAWRHTVRTVHAARHMAWHIRRGSDRHTVLASDGTRLNQSPANLQHVIYKERA